MADFVIIPGFMPDDIAEMNREAFAKYPRGSRELQLAIEEINTYARETYPKLFKPEPKRPEEEW